MQNQLQMTFSYSLEGALKRILFESPGSLSENEIVSNVETNYSIGEIRAKEPVRARIHKALTAPHSPFVEDNGGWQLGSANGEPLHDVTYQLFRELQHPLKQGEILRLLQQRTHRSKGDLMSRVNLESDWRFARLEEGDWVLTEWDMTGSRQTSAAENSQLSAPKEEISSMKSNDIVTSIAVELQEHLNHLDKRQQEIPQEVIQSFHSEDLKSIESLMVEKKKIEEFANDLRELMNKWSSQKELIHA